MMDMLATAVSALDEIKKGSISVMISTTTKAVLAIGIENLATFDQILRT